MLLGVLYLLGMAGPWGYGVSDKDLLSQQAQVMQVLGVVITCACTSLVLFVCCVLGPAVFWGVGVGACASFFAVLCAGGGNTGNSGNVNNHDDHPLLHQHKQQHENMLSRKSPAKKQGSVGVYNKTGQTCIVHTARFVAVG